jgi:hypothetical protein
VNENAARFVSAVRARPSEPRRRGEHAGGSLPRDDLEIASLGDRGLVHVAAEDQLGACAGQAPQGLAAA